MIIYSVIMFSAALLFLIVSIAIYRGKTELIHSYHQEKVTDKAAYGRAFGKALSLFVPTAVLSGILSLLNRMILSVTILSAGMLFAIICIVIVQLKYNKGIF